MPSKELENLKVADLQKELENRGISVGKKMKKAELIEKLQEAMEKEELEAEVRLPP
jgi:hypothetical protein